MTRGVTGDKRHCQPFVITFFLGLLCWPPETFLLLQSSILENLTVLLCPPQAFTSPYRPKL